MRVRLLRRACASRSSQVHVFGSFVFYPFMILIAIISTRLALLVALPVQMCDHSSNCIIRCIIDATIAYDSSTFHCFIAISSQFYRLIYIQTSCDIKIVHFGRLKSNLVRSQIQSIDCLINVGLLMLKLSQLLFSLILFHETSLKDARSDSQLELVLFNLLIEILYYLSVLPLILLDFATKGSNPSLVLIQRFYVPFRQLTSINYDYQ